MRYLADIIVVILLLVTIFINIKNNESNNEFKKLTVEALQLVNERLNLHETYMFRESE